MNEDANNISRIDSIDFLRGLSVIAVILLHAHMYMPLGMVFTQATFLAHIYNALFWSGHYGVIAFFVISGFLITTTSIKRWGSLQQIPYKAFYLRRFARIMPCLFGLLVILSALVLFNIPGFTFDPAEVSLTQALFAALTFHLNWLEAKIGYLPEPWNVLWSLSVEEMFYLFFPILCIWVKNNRQFIFIMFFFIALGPLSRTLFSQNEIWQDHAYLSCMDALAFGCLAGLVATQNKLSKAQLNYFFCVGLALTLFIIILRVPYTLLLSNFGLSITMLALGVSLMLIGLCQTVKGVARRHTLTKFVQSLGRYCYEIYLSHMFIVLLFAKIYYELSAPYYTLPFFYFLILVVSGLCGWSISKHYSIPAQKMILKSKFILLNKKCDID